MSQFSPIKAARGAAANTIRHEHHKVPYHEQPLATSHPTARGTSQPRKHLSRLARADRSKLNPLEPEQYSIEQNGGAYFWSQPDLAGWIQDPSGGNVRVQADLASSSPVQSVTPEPPVVPLHQFTRSCCVLLDCSLPQMRRRAMLCGAAPNQVKHGTVQNQKHGQSVRWSEKEKNKVIGEGGERGGWSYEPTLANFLTSLCSSHAGSLSLSLANARSAHVSGFSRAWVCTCPNLAMYLFSASRSRPSVRLGTNSSAQRTGT